MSPTTRTQPKTQPNPRIFYPTKLKNQVLEALAEYYCLTIKDLVFLVYRESNATHEASMRRVLAKLDRDGLINRISYRPDDYAGYGRLPLACGLRYDGYRWAQEECPWTDPKELIKDHSPLTLEHEIKRARFHVKIVEMCEKHDIELFWKKTDLNHTVCPDDAFAIRKNGKITYYFFELENKRKSFRGLLEKYKRYDEYFGTDKCRSEWKDFSTFTVVTQMRSEEARKNILRLLSGKPVDVYIRGIRRAVINQEPIQRTNLWFTTDELVAADVARLIFQSPTDCEERQYGFLA